MNIVPAGIGQSEHGAEIRYVAVPGPPDPSTPVVFHANTIGPSTMKNRGSTAAFEGERVTSKEAIPPEGRRPSGGTETVRSTWGTGPFANAVSPAVATTMPRATRTAIPGTLGIGSRMGPPPHPQPDHEERRPVDHVALEHPVRDEQDERREDPEGKLEALKVHVIHDRENREESDLRDDEEIPRRNNVAVRRERRQSKAGRRLEGDERREHRRGPGGRIPGEEWTIDEEEDPGRDAAECQDRPAHIGSMPVPIPQEEERGQEPRGLLERARDSVPEPGPGRPSEIREIGRASCREKCERLCRS